MERLGVAVVCRLFNREQHLERRRPDYGKDIKRGGRSDLLGNGEGERELSARGRLGPSYVERKPTPAAGAALGFQTGAMPR